MPVAELCALTRLFFKQRKQHRPEAVMRIGIVKKDCCLEITEGNEPRINTLLWASTIGAKGWTTFCVSAMSASVFEKICLKGIFGYKCPGFDALLHTGKLTFQMQECSG